MYTTSIAQHKRKDVRRDLFLMVIVCGILSACTPEAVFQEKNTDAQVMSSVSLNSTVPKFEWDYSVDSDIPEVADMDGRAPGSQASGKYHTLGGHKITFSATELNSGVSGRGQIVGPYYVNVKFRTVCVEVVGNRATYAGEVLEVELSDPDPIVPIIPGSILYLAVEDNGEGDKTNPDRYHEQVYVGLPGVISCEFLTPVNPFLWYESGWFNTAGKKDQIQVK